MKYERSRGDKYALAALKSRRALIASEIIQLERQLRHRKDMLVHVDATLRMLDPSLPVESIPLKRIPQRVRLFRQGQLARLVTDALRRLNGQARAPEIVSLIIRETGHGEDARKAIAVRVRSNLAYMHRLGRVTKDGSQQDARWMLR